MTELSPQTRALLEECRRAPGLSEAKRAALKSSVLGHVAGGTSPMAAAALGKGTLAIIGVASVVLALAGGGAAWLRASGAASGAASTIAGAASAASAANAEGVANAANATSAASPSTSNGAAAAPGPPSAPSPTVEEDPNAAAIDPATGASAPRKKPAHGNANPRAHATAAPTAPASTLAAAPTASTIEPAPTTPSTSASSLEEETRLVRGASAARKAGDPTQALALLGTHASRFPHGVLERERRAERVFALCDAHRTAEARAEAASLLSDGARGALADRLRASCGGP